MNTRFAIAMARRETRTSARRLALYGSCMALGIAALVGLDGLRASVTDALGEQAQRLLGADLRLASHALFPAGVEARVAELESSTGTPAARGSSGVHPGHICNINVLKVTYSESYIKNI